MKKIIGFLILVLASCSSIYGQTSGGGGGGQVGGGNVTVQGTVTPNDCAKFVSPNVITDTGATCSGGGGGSVTVVTGTTNQIDVATGTTTPVVSLDPNIIGNFTNYTSSGMSFPAVTVTPTGGTQGSVSCTSNCYIYYVVATDSQGLTRTVSGSTSAGPTTLSGAAYNTVTVAAFTGADSPVGTCTVYRSLGQNPPTIQGSIGTIASCAAGGTLVDTGLTATAGSPPSDSSGVLTAIGAINPSSINLVNAGSFQAAQLNSYETININNCNPVPLYFGVQFETGGTFGESICVQGPSFNPSSTTYIETGGLFLAAVSNSAARATTLLSYALGTVTGAKLSAVNEVCQDSHATGSYNIFNCNEIDVQPTGTSASDYTPYFGDGLLINLYTNYNTTSFGNYPGSAITISSGSPTASTWQYGLTFAAGAFGAASTDIYVGPIASATSSNNYGSPVAMNIVGTYWNGTASQNIQYGFQTQVCNGCGTSPNYSDLLLTVSGGSSPMQTSFTLGYDSSATTAMRLEFAHSDGTTDQIVPNATTGSNYFHYFAPSTGTMSQWPSAPGTASCLGYVLSTTGYTMACSEFVDAASGGATIGSPAGGAEGSGSLNAAALYVNGVAVSTGSGVTWPASTDIVLSNATNSPAGLAPVNGDCVVGSGGAWVAGSCSGSASTNWSALTPNAANTSNGFIMSAAGTASTPTLDITGAPYAGTNANSFGTLDLTSGSAASIVTLNTAGTYFTIRQPTGGTSDLINFFTGTSSLFKVSSAGLLTVSGGVSSGNTGTFNILSASSASSSAILASAGGGIYLQSTTAATSGACTPGGSIEKAMKVWNGASSVTNTESIATTCVTGTNGAITETWSSSLVPLNVAITGALSASTSITDSGLTPGACEQPTTGGLLASAAGPCAIAINLATGTPTYTGGTGVTSVGCATSYTCTNQRGELTIVGGTATTGTIATVNFSATLSSAPGLCWANQDGGTTLFGISNGVPSTSGFTIGAAVSVLGQTVTVDYGCQP